MHSLGGAAIYLVPWGITLPWGIVYCITSQRCLQTCAETRKQDCYLESGLPKNPTKSRQFQVTHRYILKIQHRNGRSTKVWVVEDSLFVEHYGPVTLDCYTCMLDSSKKMPRAMMADCPRWSKVNIPLVEGCGQSTSNFSTWTKWTESILVHQAKCAENRPSKCAENRPSIRRNYAVLGRYLFKLYFTVWNSSWNLLYCQVIPSVKTF